MFKNKLDIDKNRIIKVGRLIWEIFLEYSVIS